MALVLVVSLYTTRIVLSALGSIDYGIFNVVGGFVSMFAFLNTSMSNAIQRFYNFKLGKEGEKSITDVYNTALQMQFLIAIALLILLESIGMWYMYTQMVIPPERFDTAMWIFQFSILSLLLTTIQIPYSAAIMAYERMDYFAFVSIFDVLAKLFVAYFISVCNKDKLFLYGILNTCISLTTFSLYISYCKYKFKYMIIRLQFNKLLMKSMFSFSSWNLLETFAYMIKGQGLNMLLNVFFGPIVNAARGISAMIMGAIQAFQVNVVIAFRPQIVKSYSLGDLNYVKKLFYSLSKISFILLSILSIPLILEIDFILSLWLGDDIPNYTKPFTILVLVNMIIASLNTPVSQVIHATGLIKKYELGTTIVICAILPISWLCLKQGFPPTIVYVVSLIMTIVNQIVSIFLLKNVFPYSLIEYSKTIILPCFIFLILVPIIPYLITYLYETSVLRLCLVCISSIIISCLTAYFLILNMSEKELIKNILKRKQ